MKTCFDFPVHCNSFAADFCKLGVLLNLDHGPLCHLLGQAWKISPVRRTVFFGHAVFSPGAYGAVLQVAWGGMLAASPLRSRWRRRGRVIGALLRYGLPRLLFRAVTLAFAECSASRQQSAFTGRRGHDDQAAPGGDNFRSSEERLL